mmetsp:Transcript_34333/g.90690  ORF Transcript_34333/g.90690 Transcript_34333/m.90690 type:complete len:111 (-) Transcript_34333:116-448(-)
MRSGGIRTWSRRKWIVSFRVSGDMECLFTALAMWAYSLVASKQLKSLRRKKALQLSSFEKVLRFWDPVTQGTMNDEFREFLLFSQTPLNSRGSGLKTLSQCRFVDIVAKY